MFLASATATDRRLVGTYYQGRLITAAWRAFSEVSVETNWWWVKLGPEGSWATWTMGRDDLTS